MRRLLWQRASPPPCFSSLLVRATIYREKYSFERMAVHCLLREDSRHLNRERRCLFLWMVIPLNGISSLKPSSFRVFKKKKEKIASWIKFSSRWKRVTEKISLSSKILLLSTSIFLQKKKKRNSLLQQLQFFPWSCFNWKFAFRLLKSVL